MSSTEGPTIIQAHASDHFRIRYEPGSSAEKNLAGIVERLEAARTAIVDLLAVHLAGPITVTLVDVYGGASVPAPETTGVVAPDAPDILEVYRPESPGVGLERLLLIIALREVTPNPVVTFLVDGLTGCVMRRLHPVAAEDPLFDLQRAQRTGRIPPIGRLQTGPTPATEQIYSAASYSFVAYALHAYGVQRFRRYLTLLRPGHGPEAASAAFGCTVQALEKGWRRHIGRSGGGVMRFLRLILPYLVPYRLKMAEILVYLLIAVAFGAGFARVQGYLLDHALIPRNLGVLVTTMLILTAGFVITLLTQVRTMYLVAFVSQSVLRDLRVRMFDLVQRLHPGFFHQVSTGDLLTRMTDDLDQVQGGLPPVLAQGIRMTLTVLVAVVLVFTLNWRLALLTLVAIPVLALVGRVTGPRAAAASMRRQRNLATSVGTLEENLRAQPVVKAFGLEQWAMGTYSQDLDKVFRSALRMTFISGTTGASFASIGSLIQLTVMGVGGYLVVQRQMTPGTLFAFLALMGQVVGPMQNLSTVIQNVQEASGSMERVQDLLQEKPAITSTTAARALPRLSGEIRIEGVSFSYTGIRSNLRDVSLSIPAGATVAIVGPSGGGKSTLLSMIMRFYDPASGSVRFDGVDLREASLESLRGQIGLVLQDNLLFNISVRENIRLGKQSATDEEVESAARVAEIHDAILAMAHGYDTLVGEGGNELSGGQRQRIAIARATVRDPAVLILDEATSALDAHTAAAIHQTLKRLARGRTTVSVTHRLEQCADADHIVVLDCGMVVEQGKHGELLEKEGTYAALWQEQMGGGDDALPPGVAHLRDISIFAQLPAHLLIPLAEQLYVERYRAGDAITRQGDPGNMLYIVRKGEVEVVVAEPAIGQRRLAVLGPGEHFGEIALLRGTRRTATVTARTPVELWALSAVDFATLCGINPTLRQTLEAVLAPRERQTARAASPVAAPEPA